MAMILHGSSRSTGFWQAHPNRRAFVYGEQDILACGEQPELFRFGIAYADSNPVRKESLLPSCGL